nr:hypothetical protein [Kibdelosporangium sp. MJ126-NF4]CEL14473.1 hypothetical protein [Kibdelosporangium sp. MJ126-NF4]CTQ88838.1 hypothetical protein [Kibdelosporangium sp. MJ126-NF4]
MVTHPDELAGLDPFEVWTSVKPLNEVLDPFDFHHRMAAYRTLVDAANPDSRFGADNRRTPATPPRAAACSDICSVPDGETGRSCVFGFSFGESRRCRSLFVSRRLPARIIVLVDRRVRFPANNLSVRTGY